MASLWTARLYRRKDIIEVDNVQLGKAEPPRLWRYHKPRGLVVPNNMKRGDTIFTHLPENLPRYLCRAADIDSEGLLLLTMMASWHAIWNCRQLAGHANIGFG